MTRMAEAALGIARKPDPIHKGGTSIVEKITQNVSYNGYDLLLM